jgi:hypothetical protein
MDGARDTGLPIEVCGCSSPPRRVCDICEPPPFLACSAACLRRHQSQAHGRGTDAPERAFEFQVGLNRNIETSPQRYATHRERLMRLIATAGGGRDICIFGAGNCADLDAERLARDFAEIHLVDIDPEALGRGQETFPAAARDRVVLHAGIDLSGFMDRLDEWGDRFPGDRELGQAALAAIHSLLQHIGRRFDVVLSTCVLSQLPLPYRRTWVTSRRNWNQLTASLTAVHLATVAGTVQPGGHGIVAFDVIGARAAPGLRGIDANDSEGLQAFIDREVGAGTVRLDWEPAAILERMKSPALAAIVESPRLIGPWLWNTGNALLVYGLTFDHP